LNLKIITKNKNIPTAINTTGLLRLALGRTGNKAYGYQLVVKIKYFVQSNEQNVLRVETTINDPGKFRVFRHKQGRSCDTAKSRLPLRKGVADIPLRSCVKNPSKTR
jgi:hypothetical protein